MFSKSLLSLAAVAGTVAFSAQASAITYTEDFEADFPAWESGWFGTNSNAWNYYVGLGDPNTNRGNNPDGLWIQQEGQSCVCSVTITFDQAFGEGLESFSLDVASYLSDSTLTIFDSTGATLLSTVVTPTYGAFTDPGVYVNYGVTSTTGIGGFSFSGSAAGNTSIDNLVANGTAVPEASTWAMMILGLGLAGASLRSRKPVVTYAAA